MVVAAVVMVVAAAVVIVVVAAVTTCRLIFKGESIQEECLEHFGTLHLSYWAASRSLRTNHHPHHSIYNCVLKCSRHSSLTA
jgi:hypothetical protein